MRKDWWKYALTAIAGAATLWGYSQYQLTQERINLGVAAYQAIGLYQQQGALPPLQAPSQEAPETPQEALESTSESQGGL